MNKKILSLGAAVVISGSLMITSAFGAMSTTSAGYEALKTAHKQSHEIDNLTTNANLSIKDGGQSIVDLQSKFKINIDQSNSSGVIRMNQDGESFDIDLYANQAQLVLKTSESNTYYVVEHEESESDSDSRKHHSTHDPAMAEDAERIIDALVGNYQNYFQLEETSGDSSVVTLSMHDDEIPVLVRTLGSILIKNATKEHSTSNEMELHSAFKPLHDISLPELTEDIRLSGIDFKTVISSDQLIEQYDMLITASGKDAEGAFHELEFNLQLNFSDYNQTQVDVINLHDVNVEKIDSEQFFQHKSHH